MRHLLAWLGFCFAIGYFINALAMPAPAQNFGRIESRLSRLESENSRLRSRVASLEAALRRSNRGSVDPSPAPPLPDIPASAASNDPMFDRLAILVIELKERVKVLEARVFPSEERNKLNSVD